MSGSPGSWKELEREAVQEGQVTGRSREVVCQDQQADSDDKNATDNLYLVEMILEAVVE